MPTPLNNLISLEKALRAQTPLVKANQERTDSKVWKSFDSIETIKVEAKQTNFEERPSLPAPKKSANPDYITQLAAAFAKIYGTMDASTSSMTKDFASMQQLDQTMSQSVLASTQLAINKEKHQIEVMQELAEMQREQAAVAKNLNIAFWVLGGVLLAATVVSAVWDAGVSLMAVPEEVTELAGEGGVAASEETGEAGLQAGTTVGENAEELETLSDSSISSTTNVDQGNETANAVENTTEKSTVENAKSAAKQNLARRIVNGVRKDSLAKRVLMQCFKRSGQAVLSAILSLPTLVDGIANLQLSGKEQDAADAQAAVGPAVARMQENNMYFQFYQQLINREGGNLTQEVDGTTDVVGTYSDIMNAVRQISYGLANRI